MFETNLELRQIESQMLLEEQHSRLRRARSPLHILVVDDDPVTRKLMQSLLSSHYCVTLCESVQQGMVEYMRIIPDLVFLDIDLGDKDFNGFDVAYTICMHDSHAEIVILTAHESPKNIAHATRAGAVGFLVKPFGASRIMHYVQECERAKLAQGTRPWS